MDEVIVYFDPDEDEFIVVGDGDGTIELTIDEARELARQLLAVVNADPQF